MKQLIFKKVYHGFEDAADMERDILECMDPAFNENAIGNGEFQGDVIVTVEYEESD